MNVVRYVPTDLLISPGNSLVTRTEREGRRRVAAAVSSWRRETRIEARDLSGHGGIEKRRGMCNGWHLRVISTYSARGYETNVFRAPLEVLK